MPTIKTAFADAFGRDQADAIEMAGMTHYEIERANREAEADEDIDAMRQPSGYGSDPFRTALLYAVGYECYTRPEFREWHGITADEQEIDQWIKANVSITEHDGDIDQQSLKVGTYDRFIVR